ncbi:MAG: flippase-like domain-containing protein [Polyangiaceae bacterium]|jgi:uncharacterized membrane protein YbhN (UPF0104 family)|nr:flippase-like domain-containing protein [Polyangiaceae bacterium]MBK8939351.1 flippase-like domain-containing protein [Polyangiaceae bacterium]
MPHPADPPPAETSISVAPPVLGRVDDAPPWAKALRVIGLVAGLALFGYTLRDLQPGQLRALLAELGPACLLILVPQAVGILFHTAAWRELLAALRGRATFFALGGVYVEAEAIRMALPAGPAISETFSAWQVKHRFEVPWTRSLASIAAKKAWVLCTHAALFVLLLALGAAAFDRLAQGVPGGFALGWVAGGMALALVSTGALTLVLLASRRAGRAVVNVLAKLPVARVRAWAEEQRARPEAVAAASIGWKSHAISGLYLLGQWATEVLETWLILQLLGVPISLTEALVVELGGSLVRSLAFVVPGGLGVQDASYVSLLGGLGLGAPGSLAAFVLLKRTKDIFYVLFGLAIFALGKKRRSLEAHPTLAENQL